VKESVDYNVTISDAALTMLDSHIGFLVRVSIQAALNLMDELMSDIGSLSKFPERFPIFDSEFIPYNRYRKMLSAKRYFIIYEIEGIDVSVDYIVDCRQDYDWLLL